MRTTLSVMTNLNISGCLIRAIPRLGGGLLRVSAVWLFTAMALIVRRVRPAPSTPNIKKDGALRKYTVAG